MSIKLAHEITCGSSLESWTCWCGRQVAKGETAYTQVYRDSYMNGGWCTDVVEYCSHCAEEKGLVAQYNENPEYHNRDWDKYFSDMREEVRQEIEDAKRMDGHNIQRKRQADRKACATARRKHWIDKINGAFQRVA